MPNQNLTYLLVNSEELRIKNQPHFAIPSTKYKDWKWEVCKLFPKLPDNGIFIGKKKTLFTLDC